MKVNPGNKNKFFRDYDFIIYIDNAFAMLVCYRPTKKMIIKVAKEQNIVQTFITIFFKDDLSTRTEAFFYFPLIPILSFPTFSAINNFTF
jgi:hypothetical protein